MAWSWWSHIQKKPLPPTKPTLFAEVRAEMERVKTRFGMSEDSFIAQAIFYYFMEIMFTVKPKDDFPSHCYWRGNWRNFQYAELQAHDLSATGRPGFVGIDNPWPTSILRQWEKNIYRRIAKSVTFTKKMILMRNKDFIAILRDRVEDLLAKNGFNHPPAAVLNNIAFLRRAHDQNTEEAAQAIFFETLGVIHTHNANREKLSVAYLLTYLDVEFGGSPDVLRLICDYVYPSMCYYAVDPPLPQLAPCQPAEFSFQQVDDGLYRWELYPYYLVIQGVFVAPSNITRIFNEIAPSSAGYAYCDAGDALEKSSYDENLCDYRRRCKIYIATSALLHPEFFDCYQQVASSYPPRPFDTAKVYAFFNKTFWKQKQWKKEEREIKRADSPHNSHQRLLARLKS